MQKLIKQFRSFLLIIMFLIVILGFGAFKTMPKESSPDINIPFFTITAVYPGADSQTVQQQITQKIENKLPSVENISTFNSISANNVSAITVQFKRGTDKNVAYNDLKSTIDEIRYNLPDQVKEIKIKKIDLINFPVYVFSVIGNYYPSALYDKISFIEDDLKRIGGVDHVDVIGKYVPQVEIHFNYDKLTKYNFTITQLVGIISTYIDKMPVDKKNLNGMLYSFEVTTYDNKLLENIKQVLEDISVVNFQGNSLKLKNLADITISPPFYKKLSYVDEKVGVTYFVYKVPGADMLKLVANIKDYLKTKENFFKQNNLEAKEISSGTIDVNKTFTTFVDNFRQTSLIILLIVGLFVGVKQSIGVFFAFPLVYLITFIYLNSIGYTFNNIVSFSLVLTLGIMVDNLIVIIEGFDEYLKKHEIRGENKIITDKLGQVSDDNNTLLLKYKAIEYAIKTYWKPLIAGNLTTIAMFLPLNFMLSGRIGEFMKYLPTTVDGTLIFSVIVAFVFLPIILSLLNFKNKKKKTKKKGDFQLIDLSKRWNKFFLSVIKYPKTVIVFFFLLFILSVFAFVKFGSIDFLPPTDKNNVYVNIKYDKDVSFQDNKKLTTDIYKYVKEFFDKYHPGIVKNIEVTLGDYQTFSPLENIVYKNSFNPDLSKITVKLIDTDIRDEKDNAVKIYPQLNDYLQQKIKEQKNLAEKVKEVTAFIQKNGPSSGKDIGFNLGISENYNQNYYQGGVGMIEDKKSEIEVLADAYEKILPKLEQIKGTYGWSSSLEYTNGKIKIVYDIDKLKQFNINPKDIDLFLLGLQTSSNYKGNGIFIKNLNDFGEDIIPLKGYVDLKTNFDKEGAFLNLNSILIPGTNVYLSQVIKKIKFNPEIKYFRYMDGILVLRVEAYKVPDLTLGEITKQINKILENYPEIKLTYSSDVKDMKQSMLDLKNAFLVGILLMFAVLVLNFGNYGLSLIVFSCIPLLFIGAFLLLIVMGLPFGFAAQLGMFGLIGVGVNDAILLIERYNEKIKENLGEKSFYNIDKILLDTVNSRLKPVFLTTITTVLGLITLAIKDALWGSLAIAFMGGLFTGTLITLVYIPAMLKVCYFRKINQI